MLNQNIVCLTIAGHLNASKMQNDRWANGISKQLPAILAGIFFSPLCLNSTLPIYRANQ